MPAETGALMLQAGLSSLVILTLIQLVCYKHREPRDRHRPDPIQAGTDGSRPHV